MGLTKLLEKGNIAQLERTAKFIEARNMLLAEGKVIPPHKEADYSLVDLMKGKRSRKAERPILPLPTIKSFWCDELLAYPAAGRGFEKGQNIIDAQTGWILPWQSATEFVDEKDILLGGIALFIKLKDIVPDGHNMIVLPRIIKLLNQVPEISAMSAKPDEETRIPAGLTYSGAVPDIRNNLRAIDRVREEAIRPIVRYTGKLEHRFVVDASQHPDASVGVAYMEIPKESALKKAQGEGK